MRRLREPRPQTSTDGPEAFRPCSVLRSPVHIRQCRDVYEIRRRFLVSHRFAVWAECPWAINFRSSDFAHPTSLPGRYGIGDLGPEAHASRSSGRRAKLAGAAARSNGIRFAVPAVSAFAEIRC
jgi:hypothetical protein